MKPRVTKTDNGWIMTCRHPSAKFSFKAHHWRDAYRRAFNHAFINDEHVAVRVALRKLENETED